MLSPVFALFFTLNLAYAEENFKISQLKTFFVAEKAQSATVLKRVDDGEVYTKSIVEDQGSGEKREQSLNFMITGLHPKSCHFALRKLSLFEQYKNLVDFIRDSQYDEKMGRVYFLLESKILPVKMSLSFNIPRINKAGVYDFSFDQGIFLHLKGKIHAYEYKNKCLIFSEAHWQGRHTGYPNIMVELFSETLSKISMETMFRVTKL
ncbi:MAG: hypothetical protein ACOYL6_11760 [Bacteriovoracaceae bacterium]